MHFRLPKPLHGWRQFAGEVGIIVVGVLIALGAQQLVSSNHERRAAAEANESIRAEIGTNLADLAKRIRTGSCIQARFQEISRFLDGATKGHAPFTPQWIGRPQVWTMNDNRLQAALQSGRVSLLTDEQQSEISDMFASFDAVDRSEIDEQMLWAQLRSIEGQEHLSDVTAATLRGVLNQARYIDWRIRIAFTQTSKKARATGIAIKRGSDYAGSQSICVPIQTPREIALKLSRSPYGEP